MRLPEKDGTWYGWLAIDELTVEDLIAFCQDRWPDRWQKRVGEDLVEAMVLMGYEPGRTVQLELVELETGEAFVLESVSMTTAKRNAVRTGGGAHRATVAHSRSSPTFVPTVSS